MWGSHCKETVRPLTKSNNIYSNGPPTDLHLYRRLVGGDKFLGKAYRNIEHTDGRLIAIDIRHSIRNGRHGLYRV